MLNLTGLTIEESARFIFPQNPDLADFISNAIKQTAEAEEYAGKAEEAQAEAENALDEYKRKVQAISSAINRLIDDKPKAKELREEIDRLATLLTEIAYD